MRYLDKNQCSDKNTLWTRIPVSIVQKRATINAFRDTHMNAFGVCGEGGGVHFLLLRTRAVVVSQSTRVATTTHRAPERGHWGGGDLHLRVLQRACDGRQGDG